VEGSTWSFEFMTRRQYLNVVVVLVLIGAGLSGFYWLAIRESTASLFKRGYLAFIAKRFEQAEQLAEQVLARDPEHSQALFIAGECASERGRFPEAVAFYNRISEPSSNAAEARFRAGELLILRLFQPTPAEERLRSALRLEPTHGRAQQHLSAILGLYGDTQGALQFRLARVQQGSFSEMDLLVLALGETVDDATMRENLVLNSPDDPLTWLMQANEAMRNRDPSSARELLVRVLEKRGDLLVANAKLGRVFLDQSDFVNLRNWLKHLPSEADQSPDIWLIRGDWARQQGDDRGAVRCYAESLLLDPASQRANYQLAQLLSALGHSKDAGVYSVRAHTLHELTIAAKSYLTAGTPAAVERLVNIAQRGKLKWEAWGWQQIGQAMHVKSRALRQIEQPASGSPRLLMTGDSVERLLREYPLPHLLPDVPPDSPTVPNVAVADTGKAQIAFTDAATSSGLKFQYVPGDGPSEVGLRMFQFSGGGVAVLDFDQDGWPDLYLPQGHLWPAHTEDNSTVAPTRDRLFRNLGNGRFADITEAAILTGRGYGQGVTIGDFNSDGFPDFYVATLSHNRLYRNNGDGTFSGVSAESGTAGNHWTTSCLMADLNGDGLPDIYAVNYLEDPNLHERICRNQNGRARRCSPFELEAAQDQLYLNLGNGEFEEVTRESGIAVPGGKGLGIVAADFHGSGRLDIFIANDMMPNFFFVNETESPGARPRFTESALERGLAYDRDGRAQGCMGIAIGDAQGDGLLDLFVTNYFQESNTFYAQRTGPGFEDVTQATGLREPSLKMLGFGTQFLDGDLDGSPDLIVGNGHVDDERYRGIPFQMRPQYFRNSGHGRFVELPAETLGRWFAGSYLSRGLARIDWNHDGREDFVVTNLDSPVALLTNTTRKAGRSIRVRLCGIKSNRDAIGTTVRIQCQGREQVQQLTAGDGYESSNQRHLMFGLGDATSVDVMTIRWPSGETQQFKDIASGNEYLVLEGRTTLLLLP
jgi:tetratricopeptide (TPR) repeat protein